MIPAWRLGIAALLVGVAIVLSRLRRLSLEKELAIGAIRAAVQLVAIGFALHLVFAADAPVAVFAVVGVMCLVAGWTAASRLRARTRDVFPYALASTALGAAAALVPVFVLVIPPKPWFEPRVVIPISGMMLSSAMNVVAQVFERLFAIAESDAALLEGYLALGATPKQAFAPSERAALRAALIPTINGLVTVGLVALPGMMTGQIVDGAAPEQAVRYQIVIMYELVVVAAVAGFAASWFARRLVFSKEGMLRSRAFADP